MIEHYIIKDLISNGYWSAPMEKFAGINFATRYSKEDVAKAKLPKKKVVTFIKIMET